MKDWLISASIAAALIIGLLVVLGLIIAFIGTMVVFLGFWTLPVLIVTVVFLVITTAVHDMRRN